MLQFFIKGCRSIQSCLSVCMVVLLADTTPRAAASAALE